jgi:hypothetical protein
LGSALKSYMPAAQWDSPSFAATNGWCGEMGK